MVRKAGRRKVVRKTEKAGRRIQEDSGWKIKEGWKVKTGAGRFARLEVGEEMWQVVRKAARLGRLEGG